MNLESIPAELTSRDHWCVVKLEPNPDPNKKPIKTPINARTGGGAMSNNSSTWSPFELCADLVRSGKYDGVGYFFGREDGLTGIDLDRCLQKDGKPEPWVLPILAHFQGSWVEKTWSGEGLHIWCRGEAVKTGKDPATKQIEVYNYRSPRFFFVTGDVYQEGKIKDAQDGLYWLYSNHFEEEAPRPSRTFSTDDDQKIVFEWLDAIPSDDYETWIQVGMALKAGGFPVEVWDDWSSKGNGYSPDICAKKWKTFKRTGKGIGSIHYQAVNHGWTSFRDQGDKVVHREIKSGPAPEPETEPEIGLDFSEPAPKPLKSSKKEREKNPMVEQEPEGQETLLWDKPVPLLEAFNRPVLTPSSFLPTPIAEMAEAVAEVTQTPPDLATMVALSVIATCCQKKFMITPGGSWVETINLYVCIGADPAERKSAVFKHLTSPIRIWEKENKKSTAVDRKRQKIKRKITLKRIEKLEKKAETAEDDNAQEKIIEEILQLQEDLPPEPIEPKILGGQTTVEALEMSLFTHGGKWSIMTDEGTQFQILGGLYTKGQTNLETVLKAHTGADIDVRRIGRKAYIEDAHLTVGIMTQPDIIRELGQNKSFRGSGFLARFLYCQPFESPIGSRDASSRKSLPKSISQDYARRLQDLLNFDTEEPILIELSEEAREMFDDFSQMIEDQLGPEQPLHHIRDWGGKLSGAALRISALFHLVEHGPEAEPVVSASTMEKALNLAFNLVPHAQYSFSSMAEDPAIANAKWLIGYMIRHKKAEYKIADLKKIGPFRDGGVEVLNEVLFQLKHKGIIAGPFARKGKRGQPSPYIKLNPEVDEGV